MNHGTYNQGPAPTYDATRVDDEPLFSSPPEERLPSMSRPPQQYQQETPSTFGAPPMGGTLAVAALHYNGPPVDIARPI